jgi:hypothetical protein
MGINSSKAIPALFFIRPIHTDENPPSGQGIELH